MQTKVFIEEYQGSKLLAIKEVDDDGNALRCFDSRTGEEKDQKAVIRFGIRKARVINEHMNAIIKFVEEHG